ncbi:MAG: CotH kinase family protein [Prolixibacteraceae bacterium]|nr:CotH kinase family protein [Prolixibacteraceae bacterium]
MRLVPLFISLILFQLTCAGNFNLENEPDSVQKNIIFSHQAGFYTAPFTLKISTPVAGADICYTIDGSEPSSSTSAINGGIMASIDVNPDITAGRGRTPAFVVRAVLKVSNTAITSSFTKTFIFTDKVKQQKNPGHNWPNKNVNGQRIDYEMADDVTSNSQYSIQFTHALYQIPSISVVTDMEHLFDTETGIYVNAEKKGIEWERPCSAELIFPDGTEGFSINAGLRIRGGNSAKNKNNPKHAFKLFFRGEYGNTKLKYPLFGSEGADSFDRIDLRCEQNYSWSMDGSTHNTMVKDIFSRDLQREMGQPYKRGRYYHLYLNGMYWGVFQTDERADNSYAETYFGGDKDDYDIVKVDTQPWPYFVEAADGNLNAWKQLWNLSRTGFQSNRNYYKLEGKNERGETIQGAEVLVDIDNLVDYMLVIFYTGNFDAPVSGWYSNDMPNNFYGVYNRRDKSQGFKFMAHDSEHSMFVDKVYGFNGINENRVNLGSTGSMYISDVLDFNPQWLHYRLTSNSEYSFRFADRAYELLAAAGILTPAKADSLFRIRVEEIDRAIIAESARWGDAQTHSSLTKHEHWEPEIEKMYNDYFPRRTDIVISQLKNEGLWPLGDAPLIMADDKLIENMRTEFVDNIEVSMLNPNSTGTIYYTLNNTDPRKLEGDLSNDASSFSSYDRLSLVETTVIWSRVKFDHGWSPLQKVVLRNSESNFSNLKITELHYHPEDEISGDDSVSGKKYEFIELKNTGENLIDMSNIEFTEGIIYHFPLETILMPGEFYVIASDPACFAERYGRFSDGSFAKNIANDGERISLVDQAGQFLISFEFSDKSPWPVEPDGQGYSLSAVELNPEGSPSEHTYWKASRMINGSPYADDDDQTLAKHESSINAQLKIYPSPASAYVNISINNSGELLKVNIYDVSGQLVLNTRVNDGQPLNLNSYKLNPGVYLFIIENKIQKYINRVIIN